MGVGPLPSILIYLIGVEVPSWGLIREHTFTESSERLHEAQKKKKRKIWDLFFPARKINSQSDEEAKAFIITSSSEIWISCSVLDRNGRKKFPCLFTVLSNDTIITAC